MNQKQKKLIFNLSFETGGRTVIKVVSSNTRRRILIFDQYLEIGGRLQPNFANFNLYFLSKYR